jgi:hypothetical protein
VERGSTDVFVSVLAFVGDVLFFFPVTLWILGSLVDSDLGSNLGSFLVLGIDFLVVGIDVLFFSGVIYKLCPISSFPVEGLDFPVIPLELSVAGGAVFFFSGTHFPVLLSYPYAWYE